MEYLVTGVQHYLIEGISPGYGFIAVIVALLGRQHPVGVAIVAFLFAASYIRIRSDVQNIGDT